MDQWIDTSWKDNPKSGDQQEGIVAYISSYLLDAAQGKWGRRQSRAGTIEALDGQDDPGYLHAGSQSAEARGAEQSSRHDQAKTKLYRRCTASFWGNSGNSLIRFGVPDGI